MRRPLGSPAATIAITLAAALGACARRPDADPKMVSEWLHTLYGAIRVERLSPPVASRLAAYSASALYAGLAASDARLAPLTGALNGFPVLPQPPAGAAVDGTLAAIEAERVVLDTLLREGLPTTRAAVQHLADSLEAARATRVTSADIRSASMAHGRAIGLAIVRWSRADGFDSTRTMPYAVRTGDGLWVNDAPATTYAAQSLSGATQFIAFDNPANVIKPGATGDRALILDRAKAKNKTLPAVNITGTSEPHWGDVRPFVLATWNACPVPAPPPYSRDTTSELYRNAATLVDARRTMTPERKEITLYWADNAGESGTPVGHWLSIASQMMSERKLDAAESARLAVATSVAEADAFVAAWGYKYQYSLLRPRPFIRATIDPAWEPLIPTPPFPEYPSGHSTVSSAAASVLTTLLGTGPFSDSTAISIGHPVRHFASFTAAADEAGISRIYGGIHFPYGNEGGKALGRCVGATVARRLTLSK